MIAPDNDVIKAREQLRTTDTNVNYLEQQITSLREQLEKAKKDGWISVKDRLPRKKQEVIIFAPSINNKDETIYAVCLYWNEFLQYDLEVDKYCQPTVCVTHWQPLPEPPKE